MTRILNRATSAISRFSGTSVRRDSSLARNRCRAFPRAFAARIPSRNGIPQERRVPEDRRVPRRPRVLRRPPVPRVSEALSRNSRRRTRSNGRVTAYRLLRLRGATPNAPHAAGLAADRRCVARLRCLLLEKGRRARRLDCERIIGLIGAEDDRAWLRRLD